MQKEKIKNSVLYISYGPIQQSRLSNQQVTVRGVSCNIAVYVNYGSMYSAENRRLISWILFETKNNCIYILKKSWLYLYML